MLLRVLDGLLTVAQVADFSQVDWTADLLFIARTDKEQSIVCRADQLPGNCTAVEAGWRALRIEGQLDFALIGILAKISAALAAQAIGLFVISTFDTDYILVKAEKLDRAIDALIHAGYEFAGIGNQSTVHERQTADLDRQAINPG